MKRTISILSLLVPLLFAGCGRSHPSQGAKTSGAAVTAPVVTARSTDLNDSYEAVGSVQSKTTSVIATRMSGNVLSVNVTAGDAVQAGQLLLQIDDADIQAHIARARAGQSEAEHALQEAESGIKAADAAKAAADANKTLATANYDRAVELRKRNSNSKLEFDQMEAAYKAAVADASRAEEMMKAAEAKRLQVESRIEQARAELANAQAQLIYARITSPIAGVVAMKNVDNGTMVSPGVPLMMIEDNHNYRAEVGVEESLVGKIQLESDATVVIDALGGARLKGKVAEIVPASNPANRSFIVKVDLPAADGLRSGMYARALFAMGKRQSITLPKDAVVSRGQLLMIYVVDSENIAHMRLVKTGRAIDGNVEILSGLNDGENVVAGNTDAVHEGDRIAR